MTALPETDDTLGFALVHGNNVRYRTKTVLARCLTRAASSSPLKVVDGS